MADVHESDLAHVDGCERVADEREDPGVAELHVEHHAAAGRDELRLHAVEHIRRRPIEVDAVEDRADDVKVRVKARPGIDDVEAHRFAGVGRERLILVLVRDSR